MNDRMLQNAGMMALCALCSLVLVGASIADSIPLARESAPASEYSAQKQKQTTLIKPILASHTAYVTVPATQDVGLLPIADQKQFTARHRELADMVLRALPSGCRDNLRNFYIVYTGTDHRGLGGKTTIILDGTVPDNEFIALLTHECGHVIHSNMMGSPEMGESPFKDGKETFYNNSPVLSFFSVSWKAEKTLSSGQKKTNFASGYAKTNAFEDFAESFAAYILQRDMMRERAQTNNAIAAKLLWFESYLPMPEDTFGDATYDWTGTVPWDVTRLPYVASFLQ